MKFKNFNYLLLTYSIFITLLYLYNKHTYTGIKMGASNLIGWEYKDKCPLKDSGDPLIFGPLIWPALHVIAENYPKIPNEEYKKHCYNFLKGLPYMLPCGYCGNHLLNEETTMDNQLGNNLDRNLTNAALNRSNLRNFLVDAHNNVNKHNNKKQWTYNEVKNYYKKIPACIYNDKGWFTLSPKDKIINPNKFIF